MDLNSNAEGTTLPRLVDMNLQMMHTGSLIEFTPMIYVSNQVDDSVDWAGPICLIKLTHRCPHDLHAFQE